MGTSSVRVRGRRRPRERPPYGSRCPCRIGKIAQAASDEALLDGEQRGGSAGGDLELAEDALVVVVHRAVRDAEGGGDLLVDLSANQQPEDVELPVSEPSRPGSPYPRLAGGFEHGVDGGAIEPAGGRLLDHDRGGAFGGVR